MTTSAMIVGPLIGGIFVDLFSWRLAFLINVVPIAVTLVLLACSATATRVTRRHDRLARRHPVHARSRRDGLRPDRAAQLGWGSPLDLADARARRPAVRGLPAASAHSTAPDPAAGPFRVRNFWIGQYRDRVHLRRARPERLRRGRVPAGGRRVARDARRTRQPTRSRSSWCCSARGRRARRALGSAALHDGRPAPDGVGRLLLLTVGAVLVLVAGAPGHDRARARAWRSPSHR